jgi:serine/threonine protein kinase
MVPAAEAEQRAKRLLESDEPFGPFRIVRVVSKGPAGTLHVAERRDGERVLLRVLSSTLTPAARATLDKDLGLLEAIKDPNVARVIDRGEHEGLGYYALEDRGGTNLLDLVRRCRPLDGPELAWTAAAVASGLAALHAAGVPHGNLLPTNVVVSPSGVAIVDLGWAARLSSTQADPLKDLHSLGDLLAFAACGVRPPGEGKRWDLKKRIPWLHDDVVALLDALLGPPEGRGTASEAARRLKAIAADAGVGNATPPASLVTLLRRLPDDDRTRAQGGPSGTAPGDPASTPLQDLELKPNQVIQLRPSLELVTERVLGQGGMGIVYLVRDTRLGRRAALKLVRGTTSTRARRFLRETAVTARLDHPGIPPVYEAATTPTGQDYLLMRYVEGSSMSAHLERAVEGRGATPGRSMRTLVEALVKVGEAVAYAHSRGIVHRDLKPANIMIGAFGEVLVMDWGLARDLAQSAKEDARVCTEFATVLESVRNLTNDGAFLGTPGYMAPEQARGEDVDGRADVFSVGAILAEILTGAPPFKAAADSTHDLISQTSAGRIELPVTRDPRVPLELNAIVAKALEADRAYRYRSMEALVADLKAWLAGLPVSAHRYGAGEQLGRMLRGHWLLFSSLALMTVLLGAAALAVTQATTEAIAAKQGATARVEEVEARRSVELQDLVVRGADALAAQKHDLALEYFVKALALDPEHLQAKLGKLAAEQALREEQSARLRGRDRAQATSLARQGQAALGRGEHDAARRAFIQALGFDGENADAQRGLVEVDRAERERDQARQRDERRGQGEAALRRGREQVERGRAGYRAQEDPRAVQDAYLAALRHLDQAIALEVGPEALALKVRAAQELYTLLNEEGQQDLAEFLLRSSGAPPPADAGDDLVERDPYVVTVEADRVAIRRAFASATHFLPTRAFDGLRDHLRSQGGRFRVLIEVRSEITPTTPPRVHATGLWMRLEDTLARTKTAPYKLTFQGGPYTRGVTVERARRVVAPFDQAHSFDARPYVKEIEAEVRTLIASALERRPN